MNTALYLLACYGLTFTICSAKLFERPRGWIVTRSRFIAELLSCYFCTGFWASTALSTVVHWRGTLISTVGWSVVNGFAGAAFCYALDTVIRWFEPPRSEPNA
jgi:membrane associated rhomboid family serine protease